MVMGRGKCKNKRLRSEKAFYLDILRILAIVLSVMYFMGGNESSTMVSMVTSCGIPLFFMISGAALLDYNEPVLTVWGRRILPIGIGVVIFSFAYYVGDMIKTEEGIKIYSFICDLYANDRVSNFSYFYAYLGFLMALPVLRVLARHMRNESFLYLLLMGYALTAFLPFMEDLFFMRRYQLNPNFHIAFLGNMIILFPLAGYYLHYCVTDSQLKRITILAWALTVLGTFVIIWRTRHFAMYVEAGVINREYEKQIFLPLGMALFGTARILLDKIRRNKVLEEVAGCVYGVYMMQEFFISRIDFLENLRIAIPYPLWGVLVILVCGLITFLLRRIPYVNKLFTYS